MFKKLKDAALEGAMKAMGNDQVQKMVNSPEMQKIMFRALQTGMKVKNDVTDARRVLAERMNVATGDDLEDLKRKLDRLERKVQNLRDENETLKEKLEDTETGAEEPPAETEV